MRISIATICLILGAGIFLPLIGQGQINDPLAGKDEQEVNNIRKQEGIPDSEKPDLQAPRVKVKAEPGDVDFEQKDFDVETQYKPSDPKARKPGKEVWPRLYNNYLKVGFGRFNTPFARLYLNNGRNDDVDAGLDFTHISSHKGYLDYTEFRKDYGTLKASYFLKDHTMGGKLMVYNTNYFYFADTIVTDRPDLKDTIRQNFTRIGVEAFLMRNPTKESINYDVRLRFEDYIDRYKNSDLHISVLPTLDWMITEDIGAAISSNLTFSNAKFDSTTQSRIFFDLTPTVNYTKEAFHAEAGLKINSFSDSAGKFGVYPILKASYQLIPKTLKLYAGLQGEMHNNRYYDQIMVNPYLNPRAQPDIRPSRENFHFNIGATGAFADYFSFDVKGYMRSVKDQLMFYTPGDGAYYNMVYDSTFNEQGLDLSLGFNKDDKIRAGIRGRFRNFNTSNQDFYWNEPALRTDLWASYNFADKVWVTTEVFIYGKRTMSLDTLGNPLTQNSMADINLTADYRFSDRISLFLELNNLLGNQYFRWHNYQERPFDVKGGVTLSF